MTQNETAAAMVRRLTAEIDRDEQHRASLQNEYTATAYAAQQGDVDSKNRSREIRKTLDAVNAQMGEKRAALTKAREEEDRERAKRHTEDQAHRCGVVRAQLDKRVALGRRADELIAELGKVLVEEKQLGLAAHVNAQNFMSQDQFWATTPTALHHYALTHLFIQADLLMEHGCRTHLFDEFGHRTLTLEAVASMDRDKIALRLPAAPEEEAA